jgi:hypothetical protein
MHTALALLDYDDASIADLERLLLRAAMSPAFLRLQEGRRFLAYLFTLEVASLPWLHLVRAVASLPWLHPACDCFLTLASSCVRLLLYPGFILCAVASLPWLHPACDCFLTLASSCVRLLLSPGFILRRCWLRETVSGHFKVLPRDSMIWGHDPYMPWAYSAIFYPTLLSRKIVRLSKPPQAGGHIIYSAHTSSNMHTLNKL